jgi:DNA ligase-1
MPILFVNLCTVLEGIQNTSKRLEINQIFSTFLKKVIKESPESLVSCLFLSTGSVYPEFYNKELGIGEHTNP